MRKTVRTWSIRLLILPACAVALAACSSSPSNSNASSTTSTSSSTTTTGHSTTSTTSVKATTSTSATPSTLAPQSSTSTEFYSPTKNISCEIDNNFGSAGITSALCLTVTPPKSATLGTDSTVVECTGVTCLSNAGENTPTLAYGQSITLGPFTCASSTTGMKCTLASGDGFLMSTAGTQLLGAAKATSTTTTT